MAVLRMTLRQWIVVLAVVAILCVKVKREREYRLACQYEIQALVHACGESAAQPAPRVIALMNESGSALPADTRARGTSRPRRAAFHRTMFEKWTWAAAHPWLPVEPDPPPPPN